jgi:protein N-terminal glutamine amidohydrolase
LDYVPFYCEENIWRLLSGMKARLSWAVLAFGRGVTFAMLRQKAGREGDGLVFWDYHVFALVCAHNDEPEILDFDTELGLKTEAEAYLDTSFPGIRDLDDYAPVFRVLDGADYTRRLFSDRSHMRAEDGSWLASPPLWSPPGMNLPQKERWPLTELIDAKRTEPPSLFDLPSLRAFVRGIGSN